MGSSRHRAGGTSGDDSRRATKSPGVGHRSSARAADLRTFLVGALFGGAITAVVAYTTGFGVGDAGTSESTATGDDNTTATATTAAPPHDDPAVTINVTGDLLWHPPVWESGMNDDGSWDFTPVFEDISPVLNEADVAICHQETPFSEWGGPYAEWPMFKSPPQIAQGIADAGWDMCTVASNHTMDWGPEGMIRTLDAMDDAGIVHAGAARSPEEDAAPRIFTTADGVRVAVVTGTYGTNGMPVPEPWMLQDLNPDALLAKAAEARAAGADIVLAAVHAGDEGVTEPTQQQIELADILTRSPDIDAVYGHHIHAVQPIERVNGKWVVYGLGNHVAHQIPENTLAYDGMSVEFRFVPRDGGGWEVAELTYIPTIITPHGVTPVKAAPISTLFERDGVDREWLQASLDRTRGAVFSRGLSPEDVTEG